MFRGVKVAVVIPAFNEADKIAATIRSVPGFVDHIIVVDDASTDGTGAIASRISRRVGRRSMGRGARRSIETLIHPHNRGVGAAIATGYQRALVLGVGATAVMAGDGQMDPADLARLLLPVATHRADYSKGNRFAWPGYWRSMPLHRLLGNVVLSLLTRLSSGYGQIFDSQCGYTVASREALIAIDPGTMFARYGYPNDLLARLRRVGARVTDVPVRPIYGATWRSGIRVKSVMLPILLILLRGLLGRIGGAVALRKRAAGGAPALEENRWSSAS